MSSMDRIKEWAAAHRTTLIQIGAVISIAVLVSAIMINSIAASKSAFTAEVERLDGGITTVGSTVANLGSKVVTMEGTVKTARDNLEAVTETVAGATETIAALDTRMELAKGQIDTLITLTQGIGGLEVVVANITANLTAQAQALVALNATATDHSAAIAAIKADIAAIEAAIEALEAELAAMARPPEAWLTGTFRNYTLNIKTAKAGDFIATIHLCYETPVDFEAFYDSMDWGDENLKDYAPTWSIGPDGLVITKVSFSVTRFEVPAHSIGGIQVVVGGIHADYAPDWAYVEIWPAVKE